MEWVTIAAALLGGLVGWLAALSAARRSAQLTHEQDLALLARQSRDADDRIRRALIGEISENLVRRPGPTDSGGPGRGSTIRGAWDAARGLDWSPEVFSAIAEAYAAGEVADSLGGSVKRLMDDFSEAALVRERERLERMLSSVQADIKAHFYFRRALAAARDGVVEPRPDPSLWRAKQQDTATIETPSPSV
jgi:hypothetical protein